MVCVPWPPLGASRDEFNAFEIFLPSMPSAPLAMPQPTERVVTVTGTVEAFSVLPTSATVSGAVACLAADAVMALVHGVREPSASGGGVVSTGVVPRSLGNLASLSGMPCVSVGAACHGCDVGWMQRDSPAVTCRCAGAGAILGSIGTSDVRCVVAHARRLVALCGSLHRLHTCVAAA